MLTFSRREALITPAVGPLWIREAFAARVSAIDDAGFVRIGRIDQWITIRGKNPKAPVVLFLHGGPGEAMSPFLDIFLPYEQDFTWVIWDQRGTGRTYGRYGNLTPGMNLEQFIEDTIELTLHIRKRLSRKKIVLLGQSWGTFLGLQAAKRRPELFHAFAGTGQAVSNALGLLSQERYARSVFTERKDTEGLKLLDQVAQLPFTDPKRRFAVRKILMGDEDQTFLASEEAFTGPRPFPTKGAIADWVGGFTFTSNVLVPKTIGKELIDVVGFDIPLPFVVIQGTDDHITPTDVVRDYFQKVKAPSKAYTEIRGGHFCCYTNPGGFLDALRQHVLPIAG